MEEKKFMTVKEMAATMCISRPMAYEIVNRDGFPKLKVGRRIVIPRAGFERWIEEHQGEQVLQ